MSFITVDSQTIDTLGSHPDCLVSSKTALSLSINSYRSYLVGIVSKTAAKTIIQEMNIRGFVVWSTGMYGYSFKKVKNTILDSTLRPKAKDELEMPFYNPELKEELLENYCYIMLLDPVNHRPAEDEDGLFTTLLCVLEDNCKEKL